MIANIVILYPFSLALFSLILERYKFSKFLNFIIGISIIFITNIICREAVKYLEPGDYIAYIKVFDGCSSIKDCLIYSPFENGFNILIGFLREYLNLNEFDVWSIINFTNLILITIISRTLSNYFGEKNKFLSIQTLIIAFTFPSFLLISIRAGLAFLIISFLLIEVVKNNDMGLKIFFNFKNFFLILLSISIHIQTMPLVILIIFLSIKGNYFIKADTNFLPKLLKGSISKRIIIIFSSIALLICILYFNYSGIMNFIGKSYYHFGGRSFRTLGIRTLVDQIIIIAIITPTVLNSFFYERNLVFQKFFKTFVFFQIGTVTLYYLVLFVIGIDGFARQCQYNYLTFLIVHIILNKKYTILGLTPFLYSIFTIYYTFSSDISFKFLEFKLL